MSVVDELASFVLATSFDDLSPRAVDQLKIRVLDSLGCAIGAVDATPVRLVHDTLAELGGNPLCTVLGHGRSAPDRAAFANGFLVRYLDFNDSYLAPGETCHPSDNLGAVLAGWECGDGDGPALLTALAVAYQVQCRLADEAPVRARGFDHVTHLTFSAAAGVAKALGLDAERTANAIAIAGTAFHALRVTRTGQLSHWKGLAAPQAAAAATWAAFLARRGITGPAEVFEGTKGFMDTISGRFTIEWAAEKPDRVERTVLKRYNAEVHSQSAIEALIELRDREGFTGQDVDRIELETFDVAYDIIGGGAEGDKTQVRTKEEADHSLPYLLAVAALDGQVLPAQYAPERIVADDVQDLLRRVHIRPADDLSRLFPDHHACRLTVRLRDGRGFTAHKQDYEGFHTRPMSWDTVKKKFTQLAEPVLGQPTTADVAERVRQLDEAPRAGVISLLADVSAAIARHLGREDRP
jgi:2-methylcitrate dehydratase